MATVYIQEQGATVRKRDQQLLVVKDGQTLQTVPLAKVEQVVLMGRGVQMSTPLLIDLISRGVPVVLTNQQGSRHYATLSAGPSRFAALRTDQHRFVADPARALGLARQLIQAKLANQQQVLTATRWPAAPTASAQIAQARQQALTTTDIDMLRGYEGAGAAAYFGAWRASLPPAWGFGGRAFHPPPDPVNAMLSFGYTLALNDVLAAIHLTGLDPYLGVFHTVEAGRPSLALDMLEEFRPLLVDRLVLHLLTTGGITRAAFERPQARQDAIYLTADGRKTLVDQYETLLASRVDLPDGSKTTVRRALLLQAQAVTRVIRGEQQTYTPTL